MSDLHLWMQAVVRSNQKQMLARVASSIRQVTAEQRADLVTPADFATFQQQLTQEVADVIQQLRAEVDEASSGHVEQHQYSPAQNVSSRPAEPKPYEISDFSASKLRRQQCKRRVQKLHVGPAFVDASSGQIKVRTDA